MLLNFNDRTGTGAFSVVWLLLQAALQAYQSAETEKKSTTLGITRRSLIQVLQVLTLPNAA